MFKKFNKNSTGSMILFLGSSQMLANVLRIVGGLIIARLLLPKTLGLFNGFGLILGYLPLTQIGVMNGLNRELPFFFGKGDADKAKRIASVAQFWQLRIGIASSSILIIISIVKCIKGEYYEFAGYFTYGLLAFHQFYVTNYLHILFRTNNDFNKLSVISLVTAVVSLLLIVSIWKWGFYGLGVRIVVVSGLEFLLLWKYRPIQVKPLWDKEIFLEIIKVGFPIFLVGIVFSLWAVLQNTIVFKVGGAEQYGFFALALMIESSVGVLISSVNQVVYPKLSFEFGKGASLMKLVKITAKPVAVVFAILIPSVIVMWLILPGIVNWWLPQYKGGIAAGQWTLLTLLISLLGAFNLIFNVIKKQKDYLISILAGIGFFLGALYILYSFKGFSLVIFPQAMIIGKLTQLIVSFFFLSRYRTKFGAAALQSTEEQVGVEFAK